MIPPCRYYKPYYVPQDLVAANGTPIPIFGTKKLNIDVGACYTLRWTFKVADVDVPIISINFLHHFGLGIDVVNNTIILPQNSMYHRLHASRTKSNFVNRISCTNASDAIESPPSSTSTSTSLTSFRLKLLQHTTRYATYAQLTRSIILFMTNENTLLLRLTFMTL